MGLFDMAEIKEEIPLNSASSVVKRSIERDRGGHKILRAESIAAGNQVAAYEDLGKD
jgi:hypothetical protein